MWHERYDKTRASCTLGPIRIYIQPTELERLTLIVSQLHFLHVSDIISIKSLRPQGSKDTELLRHSCSTPWNIFFLTTIPPVQKKFVYKEALPQLEGRKRLKATHVWDVNKIQCGIHWILLRAHTHVRLHSLTHTSKGRVQRLKNMSNNNNNNNNESKKKKTQGPNRTLKWTSAKRRH